MLDYAIMFNFDYPGAVVKWMHYDDVVIEEDEPVTQEEIPYCRERINYFGNLGMVDFQAKAQYYYYRRLLMYYSDFRKRRMKEACRLIVSEINQNSGLINNLLSSYFAKKGDISRMKLFLVSPSLYYVVVQLYTKFLVPLKSIK